MRRNTGSGALIDPHQTHLAHRTGPVELHVEKLPIDRSHDQKIGIALVLRRCIER